MPPKSRVPATGALSGFLIAAALPPWGWWPLALIGIGLLQYSSNQASRRDRFVIGWAAGSTWLAIGEFWMIDLTAPGYFGVFIVFGAGYGLVNAAAGQGDQRLLLLPAGFVLYEWFRWSYPFGGVPLATVPMTQVDSPLNATLPLLGGPLLTATTVVVGSALALLARRRFDVAGIVFAASAVAIIAGTIAPNGSDIGEVDVAVVQGGGPQRTRADTCENQNVFDRHATATATISEPVDLVVWPENVVNPIADGTSLGRCDDLLFMSEAAEAVSQIATEQDAVLIPGWFHGDGPDHTVNYSTAVEPDGTVVSRYDKVRTVPFGEFVPLRGLIEAFSSDVPGRDVRQGEGPAVLESSVGTLGISISWEVFFESRGRAAINDGGEILINPTNGSSYWLTILQSQQVASSRLRAMETGRWVLQAAPTGFSAIVNPDGEVLQRTGISEQAVLLETVQRRSGLTLATRLGPTPMLLFAAGAFVAVAAQRTRKKPELQSLEEATAEV